MSICAKCDGKRMTTCTSCDGKGNRYFVPALDIWEADCSECHGSGIILCSACFGRGVSPAPTVRTPLSNPTVTRSI